MMFRNCICGRFAFHRLRNVVLTASLMTVSSACILWAQSPKNSDSNAVSPDAGDELDRGQIEVSNSVLHSKVVSEKGETIGEISDLLLDLQRGHLSIVAITRRSPQTTKSQVIAVPWAGLKRSKENEFQIRFSPEKLTLAPELTVKQEGASLTRQWASSIYDHFGIQERTAKKETPKTVEDNHLVRATSLEKLRVNNLSGSKLGHLAGFAIATSDGLLIYAAMAVNESDHGLQGIPLSAYIVKPSQTEWLLDISEETLADRPGFARAAWPATIERGWSEYVHVLYGRPVFEGVRTAARTVDVKP